MLRIGLEPRIERTAHGAQALERRRQLVRPTDIEHAPIPLANLRARLREVEHLSKEEKQRCHQSKRRRAKSSDFSSVDLSIVGHFRERLRKTNSTKKERMNAITM